jgi:hypothetical protein
MTKGEASPLASYWPALFYGDNMSLAFVVEILSYKA